ncbi:MAG: hypothetical protein JXB26_14535, partial [Candidatus Aminicenantes bacterium]|nr:hypothetical protein [Candidatus Aminicenantes bacterium]
MKSKRLRHIFSLFLIFFLTGVFSAGADTVGKLSGKDLKIFSWRGIGPYNFSGRITNFCVPPGQNKVYYVATATGGIWKTEDHGTSFEPIFDSQGLMSMGDIAVAPSDHNIIYIGTGEAHHARSTAHGNGVWKSTNAGKTWKHIGLKESYIIPKIIVHPENPEIVYVAAEGKLYDNNMDCQRGLYKTTDGGETWTQILDLKDRGIGDFVIDPTNPNVIIAFAYKTYRRTWTFIDRQPGNHITKSTDGGQTWKKLTNGLPTNIKMGRFGITIYPKNPNIVYIRLDEEVNLGFDEREGRYLFREGGVFRDGYYFNKFKTYTIPSNLSRLVTFEPVEAKDEAELAEKLNKIIEDKEFLKKTGVDFSAFNDKARGVYKNDKDLLGVIDEIEKTLKNKAEELPRIEEANRLVLDLLLTETGEVKEEFKELVTFEEGKIKDAATLAAGKEEFARDRFLMDKLGLDFSKFQREAAKVYKDDKEVENKLNEAKETAKEMRNTEGRTQTLNRYVLQMLYGEALSVMEPVKKSGVIYRSEDQGETWKRQTE